MKSRLCGLFTAVFAFFSMGVVSGAVSPSEPSSMSMFYMFIAKFVGVLIIVYLLVLLTGKIGKAYQKKHGDKGLGAAPADREKEMRELFSCPEEEEKELDENDCTH